MSVLVCGGAGYIGSHCVKTLVEKGEDVVVVDSLATGHRASVHSGAKFYELNISNIPEMEAIIKENNVDSCIHFSAYSLVGESVEKPLDYFKNNFCATCNLLTALNSTGVKHIVFSSTAAVYGEPDLEIIPEDAPTNPINPYGESKLAMEKMIRWNANATGMTYVALRYFNVAGAAQDASIGEDHRPETHLIPVALKSILSGKKMYVFGDDYPTPDGSCVRDYIHIDDLIHAHILALDHLKSGGISSVYNLGYSHGYSVKQILDGVGEVLGIDFKYEVGERRAGDPAILVADATRIKKELGWQPKHDDLKDIIQSAYNWHSTHPGGYGDD